MLEKTKRSAKKGKTASVNLKVTKKIPKITVYKEKQTRIEILQDIAEQTHLNKVQVENVFDSLTRIIAGHMKKRGSGEITIPKTGIKIRRIKKKASKSRQMVSPLTGQEVTIAAKPARASVKISALKVLKEMVD